MISLAAQIVAIHYKEQIFRVQCWPDEHIGRWLRNSQRFYEEGMLTWIDENLEHGETWIDAGAFIGTHSLFLAGVCDALVFAFEPQHQAFQLLCRNAVLNRCFDRIIAMPYALDDRYGTYDVESTRENMGMSTLKPGDRVRAVRLDDFLLGRRVYGIKLDCEGMEQSILCGAAETLERDRPHIFSEARDDQDSAVAEILEPLGYTRGPRFNATPTYYWEPPCASVS